MPRHPQTDNDTGLTPVPVAVILPPTHPDHRLQPAHPGPRNGAIWSPTTVALLVATYTRSGDLIANPATDPTITKVADWLGRRTTRHLTKRHHHPDTDGPQRGTDQAALVLDLTPGPGRGGLEPNHLADWIRLRRDALRPRGFLLVAVEAPATRGAFTDRATPLITAARTAGLIYHQHLVVVHAPLHEPDPKPRQAAPPGRLVGGRHGRVHSDLYAFTSGDVDE